MAPVEETIQIAARVPIKLYDELAYLAREADRSVSAELRRAIKFYVEQATKEAA